MLTKIVRLSAERRFVEPHLYKSSSTKLNRYINDSRAIVTLTETMTPNQGGVMDSVIIECGMVITVIGLNIHMAVEKPRGRSLIGMKPVRADITRAMEACQQRAVENRRRGELQ